MLKAFLFDFGGVLAEEGFRDGLKAIGRKNGLDPELFFAVADSLIFESGYLTGRSDEAAYWNILRERTGIAGSNRELRDEILGRFVLRPGMVAAVDRLRSQGFIVALLSDQTNWLDELDRRTSLSAHFDRVFNSYNIHKSKREAAIFRDVCGALDVDTGETLFIDDNIDHIRRAADAGLQTIHFTTFEDFEKKLCDFLEPVRARQRS
jgi:putative hydrolase of the HAD superfamily